MRRTRDPLILLLVPAISLILVVCGGDTGDEGGLTGRVESDGSSTVYPIAEAVTEEFQIENRGVRATVAQSGTGGGFKRFCAGETDVSNASRPVKDSERETCAENGVDFIEFWVAWDGLSVVVNPSNSFVTCLTVDELRKIWEPNSAVRTWRDVRPEFPAEKIKLYGPGTDSGTFDYFTEEIVGAGGASRTDYQASEDDNVLVRGVSGDSYSLGYFGFAYYAENMDKLTVVEIDGGDGCVAPTQTTIESGVYKPLSRPLHFYVSKTSLDRPEVRAYVEFFVEHAEELIKPTGYIPLSRELYDDELRKIAGAGAANVATPRSEGR